MDFKSNAAITQQNAPDLACQNAKIDLVNAGDIINVEEARLSVLNYLQDAPMAPDDKRHIYGYTFGLNKLKEFYNKIESYNNDPKNDLKIEGVRIYHGKSIREKPSLPLIEGILYKDVVLMPIVEGGDDLYKILPPFKDKNGEEIILGESRPCPNQCGSSFIDV